MRQYDLAAIEYKFLFEEVKRKDTRASIIFLEMYTLCFVGSIYLDPDTYYTTLRKPIKEIEANVISLHDATLETYQPEKHILCRMAFL